MPGVFISYSRRDRDFVQRLNEAFRERGFDVWVDLEDIPPSAQWLEEIHAGITSSDGIVFVISPDSVASEVCLQELRHAAERNKRIVPVVHREPGPAPVPDLVAALNWVFLRDEDDFEAGVQALVTALETDLDHVRTHTRLGVEAERWDARGREGSQLLRGAELKEAEAWLVGAGDKQPAPTQLQSEFLVASRQAATRRQRALIGGISLALVAAIAGLVAALILREQAAAARDRARAQLDDTAAQASYATDPQTSVKDALAAVGIVRTGDTEEALRQALAQSHLREVFTFPTAAANNADAVWSPDGTRLLVAGPGVSARIYRPGTDAAPVTLPAPSAAKLVAWDRRGDRVIVGGAHPAVFDAATGRRVAALPGRAIEAALSADGTEALTTDVQVRGQAIHYGPTRIWDLASGRALASFSFTLQGGVTCLAWAPDGSVVAQCDESQPTASNIGGTGSLDVWDARTGRLLYSKRSPGPISSVAFSPDSSRFVYTTTSQAPANNAKVTGSQALQQAARSAGQAGTFVDDARTGRTVIAFAGSGSAATFSPDGAELAYATLAGSLAYVYNFESRLDQPLVGASARIDAIAFNAAGTDVVAGGADQIARVYDAGNGDLLETLADGQTDDVTEASFGMADTAIATASRDGSVRVWAAPVPRPRVQRTLSGALAPPVSASFTTDGRRVVEAGGGGGGEVVDARTLRPLARFAVPAGYRLVAAGETRNGRLLGGIGVRVSGTTITGAIAETWDPRSGRRLATAGPPAGTSLTFANVDPQGRRLVTLGLDGVAEVVDARSGRVLHVLRGRARGALAAFSPDGRVLAIVHEPPLPAEIGLTTVLGPVTVDIWDTRTGKLRRRLVGPPLTPLIPGTAKFAPLAVAFSPNGKAVALVGAAHGDQQGTVQAWAIPTGLEIRLLIPGGGFASSVAFSPDSRMVAVGTGASAYVWHLHRPNEPIEFAHADPSQYAIGIGGGVAVAFTRDSRTLLTVGDDAVEAWNIDDHLRLFDAFIDSGAGNIDLAGSRFVTAVGTRLAVYNCDVCGDLTSLIAVATHRVKTVVIR